MKFNLLTILIFALLLAPFMAASPINTTFSNTSASVLAARDDSWDFAWNFKDANGGPYFEWWHSEEEMKATPAYAAAMAPYSNGNLNLVLQNTDASVMHINIMNKGYFFMDGGAWAIIGNIPPGGARTLRGYPGCSSNEYGNEWTCQGNPGEGALLEWTHPYPQDPERGFINLSLVDAYNTGTTVEFIHGDCQNAIAAVHHKHIIANCPAEQTMRTYGTDGQEYLGCESDCKKARFNNPAKIDEFCCEGAFENEKCQPSSQYLEPWIGSNGYLWPQDHRSLRSNCRIGSTVKVTYGASAIGAAGLISASMQWSI